MIKTKSKCHVIYATINVITEKGNKDKKKKLILDKRAKNIISVFLIFSIISFIFLCYLMSFLSSSLISDNYGSGEDGQVIFTSSTKFFGNLVNNSDYIWNGSNVLYLKTDKIFNFTDFTLGYNMILAPLNITGAVLYLRANGIMTIEGNISASFAYSYNPVRGNLTWIQFDSGSGIITMPNVKYGGRGSDGQSATADNNQGGNAGLSGYGLDNGFGGGGGGGGASGQAGGADTYGAGGNGGTAGNGTIAPVGGVGIRCNTGECAEDGTAGTYGGGGGGASVLTELNVDATGGNGGSEYGANGTNPGTCSAIGSDAGAGCGGGGGAGGYAGYSGVNVYIKSLTLNFSGIIDTSGSNGGRGGNGADGIVSFTDDDNIAAGAGGGGGGGGGGNAGNINITYSFSLNNSGINMSIGGIEGIGGLNGSCAFNDGTCAGGLNGNSGGTGNSGIYSLTFLDVSQFYSINLITLNNSNFSTHTPDINFSVIGDSLTYSCILLFNSTNVGSNLSTLNGTNTIITSLFIADGLYNFSINCSAGATTNSSIIQKLRIDTTGVNVTILTPLEQNYNYNQSISLNLSNTDSGVGIITGCNYSIINSTGGESIIPETELEIIAGVCQNTTFNLTSIDEDYNLTICANDSLNNWGCNFLTFGIRMKSPSVVLNSPANNLYLDNGTNIYFNFTAGDSDGLKFCELLVGLFHV